MPTIAEIPKEQYVPISRFSTESADAIFDEVRSCGCKVVTRDSLPTCVLLTPERFDELMELIEDAWLGTLVEERLKHSSGVTIPAEEVYARLGLSPSSDDDGDDLVYGVDFI